MHEKTPLPDFSQLTDEHLILYGQAALQAVRDRGLDLANPNESKDNSLPWVPDTAESIEKQLPITAVGYQNSLAILNSRPSIHELSQPLDDLQLHEEFQNWLKPEKLDYIKKQQDEKPGLTYTLVASPNACISHESLGALADSFSQDLVNSADINHQLLNQYTTSQLTGFEAKSAARVHFSLIPDLYLPSFNGKVSWQRQKLAEMQSQAPFLRSPNLLEAMIYLKTRLASGDNLSDIGVNFRTSFLFFQLPADCDSGISPRVPLLFVGAWRTVHLMTSLTVCDSPAKIVVG